MPDIVSNQDTNQSKPDIVPDNVPLTAQDQAIIPPTLQEQPIIPPAVPDQPIIPPIEQNQRFTAPIGKNIAKSESTIPVAENPDAQNEVQLFEDRPSFLGDQAIIGGQKIVSKNHKSADFNKTYEANVQTNKKSHLKEIIIIGLGVFLLLIAGGIYLFINKDRYFNQQTVPSDQQVGPSVEEEASGKIDFGDTQLSEDINNDPFIQRLGPISQENDVTQKTILLQQFDISSVNTELLKIKLL
ncbi:MAG: hypothetical protein QG570_292 [Patescibacteria group bacterium]|nr:hypothetical protein [Patescibacteria group bacterium]